jgi:glycosyltransferase involved in cell wall biosynthesis
MKTSVAMCTYNGSRYLREQLESIALQTHLPDELIICDDGSTDGTVPLISEFSRRIEFPVRLFRNRENLGPTKNFEKAISHCGEDIIILSDQDDVWKPKKIERLLKSFEEHPDAAYVFSDAELIDEHGKCLNQTLWGTLEFQPGDFVGTGQLRILLKRNVVTGAGMAFLGSLFKTVTPIPSGWMHDYWIGLLGSTLSYGIAAPEPLFMYRLHMAQVCGARKETFSQKYRLSLASNEEDAWEKLKSFQKLIEHLESTGMLASLPPDRVKLLRQKEFHLLQRARSRSRSVFARTATVLGEISSGRYHRFSDSYLSAVRDLLGSQQEETSNLQ